MKKLLLAALFISSSLSASVTDNPITNSVGQILPHTLFAIPAIHTTSLYLNSEKIINKNYKKIENGKLLDFAKKECSLVLDKEVKFYVGTPTHFGLQPGCLACAVGEDNIIIEPEYYNILEELFSKTDLSEQDKGTLNIFRFILQHECGHLKNKDQRIRTIANLSIAIIKMTLFELSKKVIDFKYSQVLSVLSLNFIGNLGISALCKKQEFNADNGIKTLEALTGGKVLMNNLIRLIESNPSIALQHKLNFSHPTPQDRLANLKTLAIGA